MYFIPSKWFYWAIDNIVSQTFLLNSNLPKYRWYRGTYLFAALLMQTFSTNTNTDMDSRSLTHERNMYFDAKTSYWSHTFHRTNGNLIPVLSFTTTRSNPGPKTGYKCSILVCTHIIGTKKHIKKLVITLIYLLLKNEWPTQTGVMEISQVDQ